MRHLTIILSAILILAGCCGQKQNDSMTITNKEDLVFPVGEPNSAYAQYFIGDSFLARLDGGYSNVTFEPGCRNNWHIHHGAIQVLICVAGEGWYQEWNKPAVKLTPGVIIEVPEGVKHWHGASAGSWMQHLTTHRILSEENSNEWLEPVSDEQYNVLPKSDGTASKNQVITVNLRYTGTNGRAKAFAEEMVSSGTVAAIRAEEGNLRYEYYQSLDDPETILLIDSWASQEAIDAHHASPMMATIAALREKYDLHMTVERYTSADMPETDNQFIRK